MPLLRAFEIVVEAVLQHLVYHQSQRNGSLPSLPLTLLFSIIFKKSFTLGLLLLLTSLSC